jgi:hypothetical protein
LWSTPNPSSETLDFLEHHTFLNDNAITLQLTVEQQELKNRSRRSFDAHAPIANVSHRNTLLCLGAEKLSRRKKQYRTEEWDQHPPCVCLRNNRDISVSISICIVIAPAVFVFLFPWRPVVIALFALFAIVVGIRQDGEN